MADTAIEWSDMVWNVLAGCSRVSAGCQACYAERLAHRLAAMGQAKYQDLTKKVGDEIRWTGEVRFIEAALSLPLSWRKPRRIFVNSMSDLFHEKVPDEWIDLIFAVMALAPQHTFQVLTKRPERMRRWFNDPGGVVPAIDGLLAEHTPAAALKTWPLPNVHLGVSVEDQATLDQRYPLLAQTPAAVRFISYEPALTAVNLLGHLMSGDRPALCRCGHGHGFTRCPNTGGVAPRCHYDGCSCHSFQRVNGIHWVIVGGESGPGARPFDLAWARSAIAQGRAAGVPVYVKQLGARPISHEEDDFASMSDTQDGWVANLRDRKGGDPAEWPEDLRVREFPK